MIFPTNISFKVKNADEHAEFIIGLEGWIATMQERGEDAATFADIVSRARHHDDKGIVKEMPEAYVEVAGRRISAGTVAEMRTLFEQEVAGHKAGVALFCKDGLRYKQVQVRRGGGR